MWACDYLYKQKTAVTPKEAWQLISHFFSKIDIVNLTRDESCGDLFYSYLVLNSINSHSSLRFVIQGC